MPQEFYRLLFDPGQHTCFGKTVKDTRVSTVRNQTEYPLFTINALHSRRDLKPSEVYHSAMKPRRADHNVICLRNILLELDQGSAEQQRRSVDNSLIPWSSCVSSGGKSLHFIISLESPVPDRLAYARIVKHIYEALIGVGVKIDAANKNPSRFSRAPGVRRPETGLMQELVVLRPRVKNEALEQWLSRHAPAPRIAPTPGKLLPFSRGRHLFQATKQFLDHGAADGEWNTRLYRAACNLFEVGQSFEAVVQQCSSITGRLDASDLATIKSAYRRVSVNLE